MAYTQAQLEAIDRALAAGVTRVAYGAKVTEYRSVAEMLRIRALIVAELAAEAGTASPRQIRSVAGKGV